MDWLSRHMTTRSRLLDLPPELRDAIYEFTLTLNNKRPVTFHLDSYQRASYEEATQPPLTQVSRQIRAETLPIWFGSNNFVLQTEGGKAKQARQWLLCNELHLLKLKRLSVWVRHVTLTHDRSSQGAIGLVLYRDVTTGCWKVEDAWQWITVVRKPSGLERDAKWLVGQMRAMLVNESTSHLSAEEFAALLVDLRSEYVKEKMS